MCDYVQIMFSFLFLTNTSSCMIHRVKMFKCIIYFSAQVAKTLIRKISVKVMRIFLD